MSDDDDAYPKPGEIKRLDENPAFQQSKYQQSTIHGAPRLESKQGAIDWVDQHYAIILILGKFMILNERVDGEYYLMTKKDFIDSLENVKIVTKDDEGNAKPFPVSKLWLEYHMRRTYERGIVFDPKYKFDSKTMRSGAYNTWPGFAVEPRQGDCHLFIDYVRNIICSGNNDHYHWLMCWCAQMVQEPWNKLGTSLVLKGLKGIGKSYLALTLGRLMNGKNNERKTKLYLPIDNKNSIFGNHNDHLEKVILLCLEEAIWAGDKAHESTLKHIITGDSLFINPKNLPGRSVINYIRSIIIGNADWIVPASHDERMFFVLNVSSAQKDMKEYFDALENELLNNGGLEALMYELMNYKIDVNLRTALVTEAQIEQKTASMNGVERWWFDLLCSGKLPFVKIVDDGYWVIKEKLLMDYNNSTQVRHRLNEREFGIQFKELIPLVVNGVIQYSKNGRPYNIVGTEKYTSGPSGQTERMNVHVIPKLEVCRELFNMRIKTEYDYGSGSQQWEFPTFTETNIMSNYKHF
jgi:hypothetical protein